MVTSKIRKLAAGCLLAIALVFSSGCGMTLQSLSEDQQKQLVVKTSIQFATATYLDKNPRSVTIILNITDQVMLYLASGDVYNGTTTELQNQMHKYIATMELTVAQKIALTSLSDVILSEAVAWVKIGLEDKITKEYANALFFCANTMNETAKMYILPESKDRSYSVNAPVKEEAPKEQPNGN